MINSVYFFKTVSLAHFKNRSAVAVSPLLYHAAPTTSGAGAGEKLHPERPHGSKICGIGGGTGVAFASSNHSYYYPVKIRNSFIRLELFDCRLRRHIVCP